MHSAQPCSGAPLWAPRLMYQGSGSLMLYWSCMAARHISLRSHEAYRCSLSAAHQSIIHAIGSGKSGIRLSPSRELLQDGWAA